MFFSSPFIGQTHKRMNRCAFQSTKVTKMEIMVMILLGSQGEFPAILAWILNATECLGVEAAVGLIILDRLAGQTLNAQEKHKNWDTKVYSVVVAALSV
jgi:hypothetical protein